jgi:hypothetical protein
MRKKPATCSPAKPRRVFDTACSACVADGLFVLADIAISDSVEKFIGGQAR